MKLIIYSGYSKHRICNIIRTLSPEMLKKISRH